MAKNVEKENADTILLNDLVVQRIMKNLNTKDLLAASLMNKTWNREARRVLRDKRKCILVISGENPCSKATELNEMLESISDPIPFNGISIAIDRHKCVTELCQRRIDQVYGKLLDLPLKYLEFKWSSRGKTVKCPLGQVILRLMARSLSLEELNIQEIPMNVRLEPRNAPQAGRRILPKLKILKFPSDQFEELLWAYLVKILSARAPRLEQLKNEFYPHWIHLLSPDKLHIVKNLCVHDSEDNFVDDEILSNMKKISESGAELHRLSAVLPMFLNGITLDEGPYFKCLLSIISHSANSLREVTLDRFTAAKLKDTSTDYPSIPNVTTVHFVMAFGTNAGLSHSLHGGRLAEIFPNVTSVRFSTGPHKITTGATVANNNAQFPWLAVEEVDLGDLDLNEQTVREIGMLFPNLRIVTASVSNTTPGWAPFQAIWSTWPHLQSLKIDGKLEISRDVDFDAAFCGIYPEEAKLLQEIDEKYLTAVHIVSPFPAINHLKDLKSLKIEVGTLFWNAEDEKELPSGKTFLSKATGLMALRCMPDLVFQLTAPSEITQHLAHLKEFLKTDFHPPNPTKTWNAAKFTEFLNDPQLLDIIRQSMVNSRHSLSDDDDDEDNHEGVDFSGRF